MHYSTFHATLGRYFSICLYDQLYVTNLKSIIKWYIHIKGSLYLKVGIVGSGVWICSSMLCFTLWARSVTIKRTSCYSSILSAFIKFKPSSKKTNSNRQLSFFHKQILIFHNLKQLSFIGHTSKQQAHLIYFYY
jgi:hypothetical protein